MNGLQLASRYWSIECRDRELQKLRKQKHAAHSQVYRLKLKLSEMQLAKSLLLLVYLVASQENDRLRHQMQTRVAGSHEDDLSTL